MSSRNAINGTTTTLVPPTLYHAGSRNAKLLSPPMRITSTMGLSPSMIALIAAAWTPRNTLPLSIIYISDYYTSVFYSRFRRAIYASYISRLNSAARLVPRRIYSNPKNACHISLASRNRRYLLYTSPLRSMMPRAYIIPAICDVCPACASMISFLSSL